MRITAIIIRNNYKNPMRILTDTIIIRLRMFIQIHIFRSSIKRIELKQIFL